MEPERTTHVHESDPDDCGNSALEDLIFRVESLNIGSQEVTPKADAQPIVADSTKMENTAMPQEVCENKVDAQCNADNNQTTKEEYTTTGNIKKKGLTKKQKEKMKNEKLLSDEEYLKALLADKELLGFAIALKERKPEYNGKQIYAIQSEYSINFLKCIQLGLRMVKAGIPTNTVLDDVFKRYLCNPEKPKNGESDDVRHEPKADSDDGNKKSEEINVRELSQAEKMYLMEQEAIATWMKNEEDQKRHRFETMKNRRDKKIKETNTVVVNETTPGYVGDLALEDILKHIDSKSLTNGKLNITEGHRKSEENEESVVEQNIAVHQMMKENVAETVLVEDTMIEDKEVIPQKKAKKNKKTKTGSTEPSINSSAGNVEPDSELDHHLILNTGLHRRSIEDRLKDLLFDPVVRQYLEDSAAESSPARNQRKAKLNSQMHVENTVDPAEEAIYGQVLEYYYTDKDKENKTTTSSTESPENKNRSPDFDQQKSQVPLRDPAEEKAWLEYSSRKYSRCNNNYKEKKRNMENPNNGVFGRATKFDFSLYDLE